MSRFFLECSFDPPLARAAERDMARRLGACLRIRDGAWRDCLIDRDRRRMLFSFESEHARSHRDVSRCAKLEIDGPWTGIVYTLPWPGRERDPGGEGLADVVGERTFQTPTTIRELSAIERSRTWCLRAHRVELTRLILAHDGRRAVAVFRAPDAESVRLAYRHAGPFDRVWAYRRIPALRGTANGIDDAR